MFGIDICTDATVALCFGHNVHGQGGLTRGLRAVNLNNATAWHTADAEREKLKSFGHYVDWRAEYSGQMGGGQAVLFDTAAGMHYGASSPRKDGAAIPEPDRYFSTPKNSTQTKRP